MTEREKAIEFIEKVRNDEELKEALISDPRGTLKEKAGLDIPDDFNIEKFNMEEILKQEINDDALDLVAGGGTDAKRRKPKHRDDADSLCYGFVEAILYLFK
jgi:hypothetical protein